VPATFFADPSHFWKVEDTSPKTARLRVFSFLLRDDWLEEADLIGLLPEKMPTLTAAQKVSLQHPLDGDSPDR